MASQRPIARLLRKLTRAIYWASSRPTSERRQAYKIRTTYDDAVQTIKKTTGLVVATGPFRGMRYIDLDTAPLGSVIAPSYLGSYEAELHPTLEDLIQEGFSSVVNIGSAEGYYAVGLALRMPKADIFAFEADSNTRMLCAQVTALNGVSDRVHLEGFCTTERLAELLSIEEALVICDCEGCELDVLVPEKAPGLCRATVIVELHDFINPSITETITSRFVQTHDIELIDLAARSPEPYLRWLTPLPEWIRPWIVSEFREGEPPQQWAVLRPK